MGKINLLDASVANMIAAGEVVERPASVIKELVENSIDAGANTITIEIKNGGISYMRVTDNGGGIEAGDVGLAFIRHATSKILHAEDLAAIDTLGFRGEALCSIAAVSKVILTTKTAHASTATRVYVEGGEMEDVEEVGAPDGTTIEVRKLFYNTPARMKFMKKDTTEASYITDIMQRFVLAHPEISFKYINNGKIVFSSSGDGNPVNAIYTIYGRDYAKSVIPLDYGDNVLRVSGYVGKSTISRPNRNYQSFFVNGRYIKSRAITAALDEAYKNQLMGGKFAFAVIKLDINPAFIDVNVHPKKTEVKFSDEKKVFDTVYWAVKNALYEKPAIPDVKITKRKEAYKNESFTLKAQEFVQTLIDPIKTGIETDTETKEKIQEKPIIENNPKSSAEAALSNAGASEYISKIVPDKRPEIKETIYVKNKETALYAEPPAPKKAVTLTNDYKAEKAALYENGDSYKTAAPKSGENSIRRFCEEKKENTQPDIQRSNEIKDCAVSGTENNDYKIIGTLFNTYIIIECDGKALLIDQHAAHERLNYEELKRDMENGGIKTQSLLAPVVVDLSAPEFEYAKENEARFASLGFEAEEFGTNTIIINGAPVNTEYNDIKDLFIELLGQMMSDKKHIIGESNERAMYTVACKSAIKANHALNEKEIRALVDKILAMKGINTCPHGRPIMISLTKYELEKQFKRIV